MELEQFEELCALYVMGSLADTKDIETFYQALDSGEAKFLETYQMFYRSANLLSGAIDWQEPSAQVFEKIMAQISEATFAGFEAEKIEEEAKEKASMKFKMQRFFTRVKARFSKKDKMSDQSEPVKFKLDRKFSPATGILVAVVVVLLALNGFQFFQASEQELQLNTLQEQVDTLQNRMKSQTTKLKYLEAVNSYEKKVLEFLGQPGLEIVDLKGSADQSISMGKVFWNPDTKKGVLQVIGLAPTNPDKQYQLWLNRKGEDSSINVILFGVQEGQGHFHPIAELPESKPESIDSFEITLEPKGGSETPTGSMFLKSEN